MTIEQMSDEILGLELQIQPLAQQLETLRRDLRDAESRKFISANRITKSDVEFRDGDGKPYFSTCWEFSKWLKEHSTKHWAEWNGIIYHTSDLMAGRMDSTPGNKCHLSE